jgi:hypothetical protein
MAKPNTASTNTALSFNEIAHNAAVMDATISLLIEGETGIGKSSLGSEVAKLRKQMHGTDMDVFVLDCTTADVGDFLLPMPREIDGIMQTEYAPNSALGFTNPRPVLLILDELGKASKPVKDAALPLLLEQRLGKHRLPAGSQVIGTSNLAEEGLGDSFEAHALNRMCVVEMRKPTADEWIDWASLNNVAGEVIGFVKQFPTVFQSYKDEGAQQNTYIHDPRHPERSAFVTPRSLEKLSRLLKTRSQLALNTLLPFMAGTVGEAAARDMVTMLTLADGLPALEDVYRDPNGTATPSKAIAQLIIGLNLVRAGTVTTAAAIMSYIMRFEPEIRTVLANTMVRTPDRTATFSISPDFPKLAAASTRYFS